MANKRTGFLYAAGKDVSAIEALAESGVENHCEVISFLSQQAAEKMVKSVFAKTEWFQIRRTMSMTFWPLP